MRCFTRATWLGSFLFPLVAVCVLVADQVSKAVIRVALNVGESVPTDGRFRLIHATNSGGIFGLPFDSSVLLVVGLVAAVAIIWVYLRYVRSGSPMARASLGLMLGGAAGNLIDRVRFGEVTDFLDVRLWGDYHWPAFNVADASLSVGTFMLALLLLLANARLKQQDA